MGEAEVPVEVGCLEFSADDDGNRLGLLLPPPALLPTSVEAEAEAEAAALANAGAATTGAALVATSGLVADIVSLLWRDRSGVLVPVPPAAPELALLLLGAAP